MMRARTQVGPERNVDPGQRRRILNAYEDCAVGPPRKTPPNSVENLWSCQSDGETKHINYTCYYNYY